MSSSVQNQLARRLRELHVPGNPIVFGNVYDAATASLVAAHPAAKAIATASYAIAATHGAADNDLTLEDNLASIAKIALVAQKANLPLTVDIQDGYADLAHTIREIVRLGAVGCNLEDVDNATNTLRPVDDAVARIKLTLATARDAGVPDFALNARTDVLGFDGTIEDAIARGKAYLAAGATTAFVWGGPKGRGVRTEEVRQLVAGLDGRVNVLRSSKTDALTISELKDIGVARVSVGPALYRAAMDGYKQALDNLLGTSA
ncbi:carboxyphosphonoenolpyruvate phosphonomutase-like protein [Auriculariales sp. MPI-PUGE-AT-0066]|nr:carboxyphosphonoenolpyruvate phosphonomutase-like protein [Auriculariales sp. MPI-PUGE-AT-0066]